MSPSAAAHQPTMNAPAPTPRNKESLNTIHHYKSKPINSKTFNPQKITNLSLSCRFSNMKQYRISKCNKRVPNSYISEHPRPEVPDRLVVDYKLSMLCTTLLPRCEGDIRVIDNAGNHLATRIVKGWDPLFVTERESKKRCKVLCLIFPKWQTPPPDPRLQSFKMQAVKMKIMWVRCIALALISAAPFACFNCRRLRREAKMLPSDALSNCCEPWRGLLKSSVRKSGHK